MRIIGGIILTFLMLGLFLTASSHNGLWPYVDVPSAMLVFGGTMGMLLIAFPGASWRRAFNPGKEDAPDEAADFFRVATFASAGLGVVGTLIHWIGMLGSMSPETIGSGTAVGLLPSLYGAVLSICVFFPLGLVRGGKRYHGAVGPAIFLWITLFLGAGGTIGLAMSDLFLGSSPEPIRQSLEIEHRSFEDSGLFQFETDNGE